MRKLPYNQNLRAFSLVELAIVLSIIGILTAIAINSSAIIGSATFRNARSLTESSPVPKIDNLVAWYETTLNSSFESGVINDGYADNSVAQWNWFDISPTSLNLRNQTNNQRLSPSNSLAISYQQSGIARLPSFGFNGGGGMFFSPLRKNPINNATIFMVLQPTTLNNGINYNIFDGGSSANKNMVSISTNGAFIDRGIANSISAAGKFSIGKAVIVAIYLSNNSAIYLNSLNQRLGNVAVNSGSNSISAIYIGQTANSGGTSFNGLISEVILYDRILRISEKREVMNYLRHKYQISVEGL